LQSGGVDLGARSAGGNDTEQLLPIERLKMTASLRGSRLSVGTEPASKPGPGWAGLLGRGGGLRSGKPLLLFFLV
jgi:hypothetical protein